jgi:hypothetical protein
MENWEIIDRGGFSWLRLGEDRSAVRDRLGLWSTFRRGQSLRPEAPETDQFAERGIIMVTYSSDDLVSYIEVAGPATPSLAGVPLLGRPLHEVVQELVGAGLMVHLDLDGASVEGWGVGLYSPAGIVEGVSIGE